MTINQTAKDLVDAVFANTLVAGCDLAEAGTIVCPGATYVPGQGMTPAGDDIATRIIKRSYSEFEILQANGKILSGDIKIEVQPGALTEWPKGAKIKDAGGAVYSVENWTKKTVGATILKFICQCRKGV